MIKNRILLSKKNKLKKRERKQINRLNKFNNKIKKFIAYKSLKNNN